MANVKISEISTTTTSPTGNEYVELDSGSASSKTTLTSIKNWIWNYLTSLTAVTSLADADQMSVYVSADSATKKITWANVMTAILAYTGTFTNKRVTPRITTITSSATPTINTDNCDCVTITAQAAAITSMTTNLSGTPTNFQRLVIRIKDDGTARAITWGSSFEAKGVSLPTTTVISKVLTVGFFYDSVTSKWGCVASAQEA